MKKCIKIRTYWNNNSPEGSTLGAVCRCLYDKGAAYSYHFNYLFVTYAAKVVHFLQTDKKIPRKRSQRLLFLLY